MGGRGGMGGGGGFSHAGAVRGGFSRGGFARSAGFDRGFAGRGFGGRGFRGGFFPFFGFGLGFALAADPWFYGPYGWGYGPYGWDYGPPYDDPYIDDYYGPPPPSVGGPTGAAPSGPVACGQWMWHADQSRYQWVPAPCAAPAAPAPTR